MPKSKNYPIDVTEDKFKYGHLHLIDHVPPGDPKLGALLSTYADTSNGDRKSRHWVRSVQWIENILFTSGRQYVDDILVSKLTRDTNNDLNIVSDAASQIPRPVNDMMGRYVETNIALLTENRPRPRVTPKGGRTEDIDKAQLSEWVLEYLWEALDMPELHREIARLILHCGVAWMEICHDPAVPRRITTPEVTTEKTTTIRGPGGQVIQAPVPHDVPATDESGEPIFTEKVEYGDVTAKVISPFEMHVPTSHWWDSGTGGDSDMDWIMRETYTTTQSLHDKYSAMKGKKGFGKRDGWYLDRLADVGSSNVRNLPIWWWERLTDLVEGPGPSIYVGTPEQWEGYTTVRIFDRKPSPSWPRGRTIILAGDQILYDSPKKVGARAYDPRWPNRWHPYTRFRWEPQMGSIYGRSLISKLLPKLKRVNAIDTTLIMWRRTVPIATWITPKGAHPTEDIWYGQPGNVIEYDPRMTNNQAPEPVFAPEYPRTALEERAMQIAEMEAIAGTEEILRGQRPAGVTSATMLEVLRKQALASRSSIIQAWDESLQREGSTLLQETIKHVNKDPRYVEALKILSMEKQSSRTIESFTGADLSDNVLVRVDTVSLALVSREAREQKMIEIMQYLPSLMGAPPELRNAIITELGLKESIVPQGADINRAKRMMADIRQGNLDRIIPYPEDDPYIFHALFVEEMKSDSFHNLNQQQQQILLLLIDQYKQVIQFREEQQMQMQMMLQQAGMKPGGGGGGGNQGGAPAAPVQ